MLDIKPKTPKADLITEIQELRATAERRALEHAERVDELTKQRDEARKRAAHAEHKVNVLETDVHNMLGTIRVMADSAREVRIRRSSVRDAELGLALPHHNTDEL